MADIIKGLGYSWLWFFLFITTNKHSILSCICSVIDHSRHQNVVRTKKNWPTSQKRVGQKTSKCGLKSSVSVTKQMHCKMESIDLYNYTKETLA